MKPIYIIYGDDDFKIKEYETELINKIVSPEWREFNLKYFDGNNVPTKDILESYTVIPFGGGNRLIVVEFLISSKSDTGNLENLIDGLFLLLKDDINQQNNNYIIITTFKLDRNIKSLKKLGNLVEIQEFSIPKFKDDKIISKKLYPWVEEKIRQKGKLIEKEALVNLVRATGFDRYRLNSEIEKLITYIDENKTIKYEDVKELVTDTDSDIFILLKHIAFFQKEEAIIQLRQVLLKDNPLKIIATLTTMLQKIYYIKLLLDEGKTNKEISEELKIHPFKLTNDTKLWRNFSSKHIFNALQGLLKIETNFKSTTRSITLMLETWIINFGQTLQKLS